MWREQANRTTDCKMQNNCLRRLHKVLKSKEAARKTVIRIHKTVIWLTLTYSYGTWILNETRLKKASRKEKYCEELFEMGEKDKRTFWYVFGDKPMKQFVKIRRLRSLEHLGGLETKRSIKDVAWKKSKGKIKMEGDLNRIRPHNSRPKSPVHKIHAITIWQ